MITETVTLPLSPHQLALFQGWQREKEQYEQALQVRVNIAITAIVCAEYSAADVAGCHCTATDQGIVITPPSGAVERTLELAG